MRRKKYVVLSLFLFVMLQGISSRSMAQCGDELLEQCMERSGDGEVIYRYPVQLDQQQEGSPLPVITYNIRLRAGNNYRIHLCNAAGHPGEAIASLHLNEELQATSYDLTTQQHLPWLSVECLRTGNYALSLFFQEGLQGCAAAIVIKE